jgi:hypothetical protein
MTVIRCVLFAVLLLGLTACNRVITPTPLFTAADAAGAPVLRDGVWLMEEAADPDDDEACVVNTRRPVKRWPDCANWLLLREGEVVMSNQGGKAGRGKEEWVSMPLLVVGGEPALLQLGQLDEDPARTEYSYMGFAPTRRDDAGRVVAFDYWMTLCGPPPPQGEGQPSRYLTWELLPGLTGAGDNCTTTSKDAVRQATAASQAWGGGESMRGVRDSYP